MHSTNYSNTLITVATDTKAVAATAPPQGKGSIAERQFALLFDHDYELTSDEVIFTVHADRSGITEADRETERTKFFSKGQPCMRTSPLTKTYGWGVHADDEGRIALVAMSSARYEELVADPATVKTSAMRSSR